MSDAVRALSRAIMTAAPHVTLAQLQVWLEALELPVRRSGIVTPNRVAAFIAQLASESDFVHLEEDLDYSAARLVQVWPGHFPTEDAAAPYAGQPEKLANLVYANRMGNGPPASGDGWLFRGRGLIQVTGRLNYTRCAAALKMTPEALAGLAATPGTCADTACWFWTDRKLNSMADGWEITRITRAINGDIATAPERVALSERTRTAVVTALAAM